MSKTLQTNTYKDMKRYYLSRRRWSKTIEERREERKAEERLRQEMKERNLDGQESEEKNAVDGEVTDNHFRVFKLYCNTPHLLYISL